MEELKARATALEAEFVSAPGDERYRAWKQALRSLSTARVAQTDKALLYSAQRVFEHGGKNGKLLAWLAKGSIPSTPIGSIRDRSGILLTAPNSINSRFREYLKEVYSSRANITESVLSSFLDPLSIPMLSAEAREGLEADITLEEIQVAMGHLRGGKAPGADGLPSEFYSNFAELLAPKLTSLLTKL